MDTSHQHQQVLRDYVKYYGMNQSNGECQGDPRTGANWFFFFFFFFNSTFQQIPQYIRQISHNAAFCTTRWAHVNLEPIGKVKLIY